MLQIKLLYLKHTYEKKVMAYNVKYNFNQHKCLILNHCQMDLRSCDYACNCYILGL